jgi:DNA-directed RNA polymerase specialized sigma24 family protein
MGMEATTERLERAKRGDMDAFMELFEDARPMVFSVAYRMVGPNDAEDVVMDT